MLQIDKENRAQLGDETKGFSRTLFEHDAANESGMNSMQLEW